ncbi:MAG: hypothetical protein EOP83_02760 [Verrucomicrobiaceae bacterium]|nr:MAG: hypothetical protein EOP83_02760 [Verrucomicrobiaceae bacterium]
MATLVPVGELVISIAGQDYKLVGKSVEVNRSRRMAGPTMLEIMQWLQDGSRPGQFCKEGERTDKRGTTFFLRITDPNVAFEFKMRFG